MIDPKQFPFKSANLAGVQYGYVDLPAKGKQIDTCVLVHGWPDSWYGWRHQMLALSEAGYRCLCISQVGFGAGTENPTDLKQYTFKAVAGHLSALLTINKIRRAVFIGHDWGGMVAWRMYNYFPKQVSALMVISTPYYPPAKGAFVSLEGQAKALKQFAYQIYLASDQPAKDIKTRADFVKFFNAVYAPGKGMNTDFMRLAKMDSYPETSMVPQDEFAVMVDQYYKNGITPSTGWYKTRRLNYDDDVNDFKGIEPKVEVPTLFFATALDPVLKPELSIGMEKHIPRLTRKVIQTGHFGQVEKPDEVNREMLEFLKRLEFEKMRHSI
ncbi:Alpha/Beta hydrolase protein [Protomyces lactucae-debilis]|uniref:Alpha/Beta hydrolase protein n=1 Tax=Protomyces lactucae-debilis TaxID=2754530 RepID=A0A1Y2F1G3_PROLT|nr:Alpha/Beta hydrolase protein [Protomyces lactucae-debilis]ORY77708.1 Alpha/Beta hydrolase protein [Protomyces lactucae-debilis]